MPLHMAAKNGHADTVVELIDKGAFVFAKNKKGKTELDLAKENGNKNTIDLLQRAEDNTTAPTGPIRTVTSLDR